MIHPHRAARVFFIISLTMTSAGLSGCATQEKEARAIPGYEIRKARPRGHSEIGQGRSRKVIGRFRPHRIAFPIIRRCG